MTESATYNASLLKTPPRNHARRSSLCNPPSGSSIYMTPSKTQTRTRSRNNHSSLRSIPRMSPMPSRITSQGSTPGGSTPFHTPRKTPSNSDDRYIPSRRRMNIDLCRRALLTGEKRRREEGNHPSETPSPTTTIPQETPLQKEFKRRMLSSLCNVPLDQLTEDAQPTGILSFGSKSELQSKNGSLQLENPYTHDILRGVLQPSVADLDPVSHGSVSKKIHRKVSGAPARILDAPDIVDDYYLNLISWGKDNILAVALAQSVYLWNASNGDIQHLVSTESPEDYITSVSWCTMPGRTKYIAVGTNLNSVQIYDAESLRRVRTLTGHTGRVSALAWSHQWLSSGARDSLILQHDMRSQNHIVATYEGHEQEVCGLKWNEDGTTLASGGNENYLCLWDAAMTGRNSFQQRSRHRSSFSNDSVAPRLLLTHHKAAVKALDWCPFHRGLLASGGGTADRTIKFWNSSSGAMLNSVDTGSQVCSVLWSKHQKELCSSHGYSENQLILWKYPTMTKVKELTGHTSRVLNMEMSPDGSCVVSAAADETLRFWNIFGTPAGRASAKGGLSLSGELSFGMPTIR